MDPNQKLGAGAGSRLNNTLVTQVFLNGISLFLPVYQERKAVLRLHSALGDQQGGLSDSSEECLNYLNIKNNSYFRIFFYP